MATAKRKSSSKRSSGRQVREVGIEARRKRNASTEERNPQERSGGKGGTVKSRKQAIAIGLSEARDRKARRCRASEPAKRSARKK